MDPQAARHAAADTRAAAADTRAVTGDRRAEDNAWAGAINRARDDSHRYLKDALGLTPNALGAVMKPDNDKLFKRAQPIVERELQKLRASGIRVDQVNAADIAEKALNEVEEAMKREKAGAGPRSGAPNRSGRGAAAVDGIVSGGLTWRDMLR